MIQKKINNAIAFGIVMCFLILSFSAMAEESTINQNTTSTVTSNGVNETTVKSAPPSAISPNVGGSNSDLCTISSSGALGTQILSLSLGATYTEANCLLLKKARMLYSAGMKVASVSLLCQDPAIFEAMKMAGTSCPYLGLIGDEAARAWEVHTDKIPLPKEQNEATTAEKRDSAIKIMGAVASAFLFF
jgi:hypothetical protein|tara:strand:- start:155 stop:721 length:567 start_codon:yes stop_codon:yes gene_type:complete